MSGRVRRGLLLRRALIEKWGGVWTCSTPICRELQQSVRLPHTYGTAHSQQHTAFERGEQEAAGGCRGMVDAVQELQQTITALQVMLEEESTFKEVVNTGWCLPVAACLQYAATPRMYLTHPSLVPPCTSSHAVHAKIDRNQNGKLEREEIQQFLNDYCESNGTTPPQAYQVQVVYQQLDLNGDGEQGGLCQLMGHFSRRHVSVNCNSFA